MRACMGLGSCEAGSNPHLGGQFKESSRETDCTEMVFFSVEAEGLYKSLITPLGRDGQLASAGVTLTLL